MVALPFHASLADIADRLMISTIAILVGSHLATAPRAQKEAKALRVTGTRVLIRGTWWDDRLAEEDLALAKKLDVDFCPVVDLRGRASITLRLHQRLARELFSRTGRVGPRLFGVAAPELLTESLRIKADLTMVHSEAGLWVGNALLKRGLRVGVDFEDWFSKDLPDSEHEGRPILAMGSLERQLLRKAHLCLSTTQALSLALAEDAGTARIPTVVPNAFPALERTAALLGTRDPKIEGVVSFYWFSQTIGPGRGLESLAQALALLDGEWQLALRGSLRTYQDWFERTFPESLRPRIQFLDPVPNSELLARTMTHDVGLALEEPYCPNKDLTASNKLFEYLRGGLAVIATRTRGQEEVMELCPEAGLLIPPGNQEALASAMQRLLDDPALLKKCQRASVTAAEGAWAWERHATRLQEAISSALFS